MAVISGKDGTLYITDVETTPVINWKLDKTSDNKAYHANSSAGSKERVAGVKDSTGSFEVKTDNTSNCPVDEGDGVTIELHVDDTDTNYYSVPCLISKVAVSVDIDTGEIVAYAIDFEGNGVLTPYGILDQAAPS